MWSPNPGPPPSRPSPSGWCWTGCAAGTAAGSGSGCGAPPTPPAGALRSLCEEEGFGRFEIPRDIGGRFSVLTPVGAAAGGRRRRGHRRPCWTAPGKGAAALWRPRLPGKPGGTAGGPSPPCWDRSYPVSLFGQLRALCRQPLPVADPALRREPGQGRPGPLPGGGPVHHRPALAGSVHPGGPADAVGDGALLPTPAPARR